MASVWNRYAPVKSSPLARVDPKGLLEGNNDSEVPQIPEPPTDVFLPEMPVNQSFTNTTTGLIQSIWDRRTNSSPKKPDIPSTSDPKDVVERRRRTREYESDRMPTRNYYKPHQGFPAPHVHEREDGEREHPAPLLIMAAKMNEKDMTPLESMTEGLIESLKWDRGSRSISIYVRSPWGAKRLVKIEANGVKEFRGQEFLFDNIVQEVSVVDPWSAECGNLLSELIYGGQVTDQTRTRTVDDYIRNLRHAELILLELEPVYGACIHLLATSWQCSFVE